MVIIYRGIPGSGKTKHREENYPDARVCSADEYFLDSAGIYQFDANLLSNAHASCLRKYVGFLQNVEDGDEIVVDNTGTTVMEVAPYAALAAAYKKDFIVINIICSPEVAALRNIHDVPLGELQKMENLFRQHMHLMPSWWPQKILET